MWLYHQRLLTLALLWEKFNFNFRRIWPEKPILEGYSWFKLNNLGPGLGMALTFYTNVAKGLKVKVRKFWVLSLTFVEVIGKKPVGGLFCPFTLNRVNIDTLSVMNEKKPNILVHTKGNKQIIKITNLCHSCLFQWKLFLARIGEIWKKLKNPSFFHKIWTMKIPKMEKLEKMGIMKIPKMTS